MMLGHIKVEPEAPRMTRHACAWFAMLGCKFLGFQTVISEETRFLRTVDGAIRVFMRRKRLPVSFANFQPLSQTQKAIMTAQMADQLRYQGQDGALFTLPLEAYLDLENHRAALEGLHAHTACCRGYTATWEIRDKHLFLTDLNGHFEGGEPLTLQRVFPSSNGSVFANWFSGQLRCPRGQRLRYVHMNFGSVYERDFLIEIRSGVVMSEAERLNAAIPLPEDELDLPPFLRKSAESRPR